MERMDAEEEAVYAEWRCVRVAPEEEPSTPQGLAAADGVSADARAVGAMLRNCNAPEGTQLTLDEIENSGIALGFAGLVDQESLSHAEATHMLRVLMACATGEPLSDNESCMDDDHATVTLV